MEKAEVFSKDRVYKCILWRIWDETQTLVVFIG